MRDNPEINLTPDFAPPPTFDTYEIVQSLTKAGASKSLALAVVGAVKAGISGGMATHEDIVNVKAQINDVEVGLNAKINEVDTKINEIDAKINKVEAKVNKIETRLNGIEGQIGSLERNLTFRMGGLIIALATIIQAINFLIIKG